MFDRGLVDIDWLDGEALPVRCQDAFKPMCFQVSCNGGTHEIKWTSAGGASVGAHGESGAVVAALGGEPPVCVRLADLMNRGLMTMLTANNGNVFAVTQWDADLLYHTPEEQERVSRALADLDDPAAFVVRSNTEKALAAVVREAFLSWLTSLGLPVGPNPEIQVMVSSRLSGGGFGFSDRAIFDEWDSPLVGMQLRLGAETRTRAVVCVPDSWWDGARSEGVVRDGRFFLGFNEDGAVYSHLEVTGDAWSQFVMVGGWAVSGDNLEPQNTDGLVDAANAPLAWQPEGVVVGSYRDWSNKGPQLMPQEGVHPALVLRNVRDAESWQVTADFLENFIKVDYLHDYVGYAEVPYGFDIAHCDVRKLLAAIAKEGKDPFLYGVTMTTYNTIPDRQ